MALKLVWGVEDVWIPVDRAVRLEGMLGKKGVANGLVKIEEAGHLIMLDQRERVVTELMSWLFEIS
jgi:pimeloyl-ACP methyl ester carboxylesterase